MPDSVEIASSSDLFKKIADAQKLPKLEGLGKLREIGEQIKASIAHLSTVELTDLSDAYSKAFVPIGVKPDWARLITQLILRTIDRVHDANAPKRVAGLPHHEYMPHPVGVGLADILQSAVGTPGAGRDGRVRPDLAG